MCTFFYGLILSSYGDNNEYVKKVTKNKFTAMDSRWTPCWSSVITNYKSLLQFTQFTINNSSCLDI